jgi:cobalamin biosynthesis Mg chelatase CobN
MRFTSIVLTGAFALLASAQSTTSATSAASTTIDAAQASASAAQAEILKCLDACKPGDVSCTSKCIAVPNPSDSQVNATNNCVANCPQGKGTESDIAAYQKCVEDCIGANYFTATPSPTGSSGSDNNNNGGSGSNNNNGDGSSSSGSGNDNGNTNPSSTSGNQASNTGSNAAATSTGAASQLMQVSGSAVGLLGFLAAVMAL